ncbi:conjugal transfer protein TraN [Caulobacter sp. 17J65-9]|uniref:conjugal transfer protein TraN n=1 Tax=Caulobacter sp. 17J65-9 TaxID=2709382 RepID=UPI0013CC75C4|nr:conjugal transfer protein TraN [Caulobacter sp. 17J65-9]NEX91206.1 conjugal transfer protein TraN [Caulobacter sp. 17J65-9]
MSVSRTRKIIAAALALAFAIPGASAAQTQGGGAGDFVGSQPPPTLADPITTVPGADTNVAHWSGMWNDPAGLEQVGRNSVVGNELGGIVGSSAEGTAGQVSANDDWLQRSFDVLRQPGEHAGDLVTQPTEICETRQVTETREETSLYTCETGTPTQETVAECKRQYVPIFDTDYVYECKAGTQWSSTSKTCEPERVVVVDEDYVYSCKTGTEWTQTPASCTRKRVVVVDEDYVYGCQLTWNGTTHAPNQACNAAGQPGCSIQGGRTCTQPSNLPSSYTCQTGYSETASSGQCQGEAPQVTRTTWQYKCMYKAAKNARDDARYCPEFNNNSCAVTSYRAIPIFGLTGPYIHEVYATCTTQQTTRDDLEQTGTGTIVEDDEIDWAACSTYTGQSGCTLTGEVCLQQIGAKCKKAARTYSCTTRTQGAGCSPPAGMTLTGQRCLWSDSGGVCRLYENTYGDPTGGCATFQENYRCETQVGAAGPADSIPRDVVSDTWDNGCTALQGDGSCVRQTTTNTVGAQTRTINGLPVTRDPWEVREDYICWSSTSVNSCTPFTSCTQQSNVCASTDRNGVCTAWQRQYLCENPATGGGTPQSTPREVVSEYWTDPCAANRNDPTCKLTSNAVVIGSETRTINGMSVTRDPWKRRETWTCSTSSTVDTCGPVKTGCTLIGTSCGGTDPQGACSLNLNRYRCEEPKSGAGTPVDQPVDQTGGTWEEGACAPKADPNCQLQTANQCTQGAETRTVDGHPATATCWEQTDTYVCQRPGSKTSNCQPAAGCTLREQVCLEDETKPLSQCQSIENVYECTKATETTHEETSCETKICVGQDCYTQGGGEDGEPERGFPDALAALYVANEAGKDYSIEPSIFKGEPLRCRKAVLGFRNCCKDSGWGLELGLAQCDDQEKTLMLRQEAKATHYVGTWCSKKAFFGACMEKSMRYCAFEGSLAKIVQVEGRKQITKPWGSPKSPDCSGFTIEQFQRLDLSNVDFSEFTDDMMTKVMAPGEGGTVSRIQQSIEQMMGSGTPAVPPPLPGGGG